MDEITNTNRAVIDIRCLTWFTERETHLSVTLDRHALEWKRKAETAFPDSLHSPAAVSERRQIGEPHNRGPSVAHPEASPHPNSVHRWQGTPQHKCNKSQSDHRERKGFCGWSVGEVCEVWGMYTIFIHAIRKHQSNKVSLMSHVSKNKNCCCNRAKLNINIQNTNSEEMSPSILQTNRILFTVTKSVRAVGQDATAHRNNPLLGTSNSISWGSVKPSRVKGLQLRHRGKEATLRGIWLFPLPHHYHGNSH